MLTLIYFFSLLTKNVNTSTMVLIYGVPDPVTSYPTTILTGVSYDDCVAKCYMDDKCVTCYESSDSICYLYSSGDIVKVKKQEVGDTTDGGKVAMKIQQNETCPTSASSILEGVSNVYEVYPVNSYTYTGTKNPGYYSIDYGYISSTNNTEFIDPAPACIEYFNDNVTCSMSVSELFNSGRTLKGPGWPNSGLRPTTVAGTTTIKWIKWATTCGMGDAYPLNGVSGCFIIPAETTNYLQALTNCDLRGGDGLMTIPNEAAFDTFKERKTISGKYAIGLSRTDVNSPWTWELPELVVDSSGLNWAAGEPNSANLYTYVNFGVSGTPTISTTTESEELAGYICHIPF
ncbi:hypothetical protein CAEBREN_19927 [Caenorhabditis brenneri]|uniref:C-type lectin domain-containing protein n=1 Tax=Caenorhabditis brenneri TaxID=135651 RepID=G0NWB1_CAEBE|nr:hypothetical protein CAEBREN_19927 [Caenorhabditis brenneri]